MAKDVGKPGLTTFGWLLVGGAAAALLSSKERRTKVLDAVKGFAGKAAPATDTVAPTQPA
jgi:hypothetical protein